MKNAVGKMANVHLADAVVAEPVLVAPKPARLGLLPEKMWLRLTWINA